MGEGAEFVESGVLRVDRKRALAKLKRYQLPGLERGVFFWVRAAVAAGATRLDVRQGAGFLELRFDGEPFKKGELADPYGGLFDGGDARRRFLALGLLWLVRAEASAVTVVSGGRTLAVESLENDSLSPAPDDAGGTVVFARWGGMFRPFKRSPWRRSPAEYAARCAMSGLAITVSGRDAVEDPFADRSVVHELRWRGARIRMSYGAAPAARTSVDLSVWGVRADSVAGNPRFVPARVLADSPLLGLDASEFKVVKNAALDALLERAGREEKVLLQRMLDAVEAGGADGALRAGLREACWMLLKSPRSDARDPLLKRLWRAPLAVDARGGFCSLTAALETPGAARFPDERAEKKFGALVRRAGGKPRRAGPFL